MRCCSASRRRRWPGVPLRALPTRKGGSLVAMGAVARDALWFRGAVVSATTSLRFGIGSPQQRWESRRGRFAAEHPLAAMLRPSRATCERASFRCETPLSMFGQRVAPGSVRASNRGGTVRSRAPVHRDLLGVRGDSERRAIQAGRREAEGSGRHVTAGGLRSIHCEVPYRVTTSLENGVTCCHGSDGAGAPDPGPQPSLDRGERCFGATCVDSGLSRCGSGDRARDLRNPRH